MSEENMVICPDCEARFAMEEDLEEGDITYCPECDAELEVLSVSPAKVKPLEEYEEDDDDMEDFGDEDYEEEDEEM
jgi:alpha-aminoadipate carrier protein LysW